MDMQQIRATTPEEESQGLWGLLEEKSTEKLPSPAEGGGSGGFDLWNGLQQRMDLSRRRPKRITKYEVAHLGAGSDQEYYVLRNLAAHSYVRCTPQDFFLWKLMDGQHTVRDLAVAYFAEFGNFSFERLLRLIAHLGDTGFLEEKPLQMFDALRQRFERRSWVRHLERWGNALWHQELRIRNPDAFFGALYRRGGWILFGKVARAVYIIVAATGLTLFLYGCCTSPYTLRKSEGSYALHLSLLLIMSFLVIPVHECAHALACKHYGREVLGAGAMLYYGVPAFFVDTSDMWLAPKRARIAVSWAGPFSTLVIAGLFTLFTSLANLLCCPPISRLLSINQFLPTDQLISVSQLLDQVAFAVYINTLINLNPLLEWDGYYILMDYLEIPRLRQKALDFVKSELPKRVFRDRGAFSREESLFTVFGLLSALGTAITLLLSLSTYLKIKEGLPTGRDPLLLIVVSIIVLIPGWPLVAGLAFKLASGVAAGTKKRFNRAATA